MCAIYVNFVDIFDTDRLGLQTFSAADDHELAEDFARVEWPLAWGKALLVEHLALDLKLPLEPASVD